MISIFKKFSLALIIGTFVIGLSGCPEQEGPMEETGEEIDETIDESDEEMEDVGEEMEDVGDEADDVGDKTEDVVE